MREIVRKNFNMYYIQENLANLRVKQGQEQEFIDNLDRFSAMCVQFLDQLRDEAYDSLIQTTNRLKPLEGKTAALEERERALRAELEHATETLSGIEHRWDVIMRLQNYYYVLMPTGWREQHDWIHRRAADNALEVSIYSVPRCRTANIRLKDRPDGFAIIAFFEAEVFPNLDKMKGVSPDARLLRQGLELLQSEVFTYLSQYNRTLAAYDKIVQMVRQCEARIRAQLEGKRKLIYFGQLQQQFVDKRNYVLKYETTEITQKPLQQAIKK